MRRSTTVAVFFGLAACASPGGDAERESRTSSPILSGQPSAAEHDAVVRLEAEVRGRTYVCTGTLLARNLVLTARHCVAELRSYAGFICDDKGGVVNGDARYGPDYPASAIKVFTAPGGAPAASGKKILHNGAAEVCSNDLALIVLDRAVPNAKTMPVRLESKPRAGEAFTAVGWGLTEAGDAGTRLQRKNVSVLRVGPAPGARDLPVPPNDFEAGEAICEGDSGGPSVAPTGAVIGVVSRGGNGPSGMAPPLSCKGARNHYTSTSPFKTLILQAYSEAGATPQPEVGSGGAGKDTGAACTVDGECVGGVCVSRGTGRVCSQSCEDGLCPTSFTCARSSDGRSFCAAELPRGGAGAVSPDDTKKGGCAAAPGPHGAFSTAAVLGLALAAAGARRRVRVARRRAP